MSNDEAVIWDVRCFDRNFYTWHLRWNGIERVGFGTKAQAQDALLRMARAPK